MQKGSYLAIPYSFNAIDKVFQFFSLSIMEEKEVEITPPLLKKLWKRPYLFFGQIPALAFAFDSFIYLYEATPSQLYYSEIPLKKINQVFQVPAYCFFFYPESKSAGFKLWKNEKCIRHLESEIDYEIYIDEGFALENEDHHIKKNQLDERSIEGLITELKLPIITDLTQPKSKLFLLDRISTK